MKKLLSFVITLAILVSSVAGMLVTAESLPSSFETKNVIMLIGSGISDDHLTAASVKLGKQLNMQKLSAKGSVSVLNSDSQTCDVASAATTLATAQLTTNFKLGVDPNGDSLPLITEVMKESGKKVGIISDKYLNDATPAAFAVHNSNRCDLYAIARDEINSGVDLFLGGGTYYFSKYRNELSANGYSYITSPGDLDTLSSKSGKVFGTFCNFSFDSSKDVPSLAQMLEKSTEVLDNENGFFVVAEGGLIDKYSYEHNMASMVSEVAKFDAAVGAAMEYVDAHPDTLLVVIGDCEAGALTLNSKPMTSNVNNTSFKSCANTDENTVCYAYGAPASAFSGQHKNTDIPKIIMAALGEYAFATELPVVNTNRDYIVESLNGFSSWNFTNIRKNSTYNGISMTTTTSNNTAVSVTCSKGSSLMIIANAKIGFEISFTSPLASPFALKSNSSMNLSAFDGIVISCSGATENELTFALKDDNGNVYSASFSDADKNEYKEILIPFSKFSPAITPENAENFSSLTVSGAGGSSKTTFKIDSVNVFEYDDLKNYYEVLSDGYDVYPQFYTSDSYADFEASFDALKNAKDRADRCSAKLDTLDKIAELVPLSFSSISYPIVSASENTANGSSVAVSVVDGKLYALCGSDNCTITLPSVPEMSGSYGVIELKVNSLIPAMTNADDFSITLSVETSEGTVSDTLVRPMYDDSSYCFGISADLMNFSSMSIVINNACVGTVIFIEEINVITEPKLVPPPLTPHQIMRAAACLENFEGADVNSDGAVDAVDALQVLRG